jgi:hypothetical protein
VRLRQVAIAAHDLEAVKADLEAKGLRDPFRDPGVKEFGLDNAVYPVGDTFLEVVSPVEERTTAGRYLERRGVSPVGYMVLVQVDDLDEVRQRAADAGIRTVWSIDLDDIRASHLHPRDLGAITSVDQPVDPASWRWGGPGWEDRAVPGRVDSVEVAGADPEVWARLLDRPVVDGVLTFDDGTSIRFVDGPIGVGVVDLTVDGTSVRIG